MFKVVTKRDFARSKVDFNDAFVITRNGIPQGMWLSIAKLKIMTQEEISDYLFEVLKYLGVFNDEEPEKQRRVPSR